MKTKDRKRREACERINATIIYRTSRINELRNELNREGEDKFNNIRSLINIHERKLKINEQHYTNTRNKLTTFMEIN